jgi:hypothetical protein
VLDDRVWSPIRYRNIPFHGHTLNGMENHLEMCRNRSVEGDDSALFQRSTGGIEATSVTIAGNPAQICKRYVPNKMQHDDYEACCRVFVSFTTREQEENTECAVTFVLCTS